MKLVTYVIAIMIGALGVIFLFGYQDSVLRLIIGIVLIIAALAIAFMTRLQPKPTQVTNVQKIDLSGDVNLEEIRCRSCNAPLGKDEISVEAGAIFVECSHCGATYQFEEAPKW